MMMMMMMIPLSSNKIYEQRNISTHRSRQSNCRLIINTEIQLLTAPGDCQVNPATQASD